MRITRSFNWRVCWFLLIREGCSRLFLPASGDYDSYLLEFKFDPELVSATRCLVLRYAVGSLTMKPGLVGGLVLLGHGAAAQTAGVYPPSFKLGQADGATEIRHGYMRFPGMVVEGPDGKRVVMVDSAPAIAANDGGVPEVIVYVDDKNSALTTTTEMIRVRPFRPRPTGFRGVGGSWPRPGRAQPEPNSQPSPSPSPSPPPSSSQPSPSPDDPNLHPQHIPTHAAANATGITYSPYNADGTCRSASQILDDFQRLATHTDPPARLVRIYGVDCDQVARVLPAADAIGVQLFLGIFSLDDLPGQIATLSAAVNSSARGWTAIDTVSVGNELVNNGQATAKQVVDALAAARGMLRAQGYAGPVVTVDTFFAVERNPELCDASDYCAINVHAFFDADTAAERAGDFVARKVADVREVLRDSGKRVVVTETGWPWQGNANGLAVPGRENQRVAVRSILDVWGKENPGGLILFTAFDEAWKKAEKGTFYAEQFWGMYEAS